MGERSIVSPLSSIDWTRPYFAPFAAIGVPLAERIAQGEPVHAALDAAAARLAIPGATGQPLRFVPQQALPPGLPYESHIHDRAEVPTRDNLHDFFNGLIWLHFPQAKAALNRLQAGAIRQQGIGAVRGPLRDAATLFDENAVLFIHAHGDCEQWLRDFRWQQLFVSHRAAWGEQCTVVPFGHALLEKLVSPYKAVTAHAWPIVGDPQQATPARLDVPLAGTLSPDRLSARAFAPLPVLGIPGWCDANAMPGFYDDPAVFRAGRRQRC
ncbi:Protein of unknown function (DUF3025) [Cupriavidus gilardii J11]|uniref:DUF3025 family protein n=1 Tax=Cupriavidus gilardii J11 TaxID=936133 RepID=A0A562BFP9_9BURK|nr:DUF3025 domain-containing protein [Cupriavidus gilardii]TWG83941.1 Protein of unknown function (DUF3025) [Cupriavidus gilardii J11]